MSVNNFVANNAVQKQIYEEKAWKEKLSASFWSRFWEFPTVGGSNHIDVGRKTTVVESSQNMPVVVKRDLMKQQGDKMNFDLVLALTGEGITDSSGQSLEGNEESMLAFRFPIELEGYNHAVADKNPLGRKKAAFVITEAMKDQLSGWGIEKLDKLSFSAIETAPTTLLYQGAATQDSELTSSDKITMSLLRKAKTIALTRNDGARYLIEPFHFKGNKFLFAVAHPDVIYDMEEDAEFKQAQQNALNRGGYYDHPIFAGAEAISAHGVVLFSSERSTITTNYGAGGTTAGAKISLFGNKALCVAMGVAPVIDMEFKDYRRRIGYGYKAILRVEKPNFNSKDYGSMQIRVARTQISDS